MNQPPKNNSQKPDLQLKNNQMNPLMQALGANMKALKPKKGISGALGERNENKNYRRNKR